MNRISGAGEAAAAKPDPGWDEGAQPQLDIARHVIRVRLSQMLINEKYRNGEFKVPIHLAMGHEAIAVAVEFALGEEDRLLLSHRNVHYNLARIRRLKPEIDEYLLKPEGLAGGTRGSMNLSNPGRGIIYASSILGNNLAVAAGFALANRVRRREGVVFVETGDGAIEEGSFYESLLFMASNSLPCILIIEDNGWSLATRINDRRCHIDLERFAGSLSVGLLTLVSNDVYEYIARIKEIRAQCLEERRPVCLHVKLATLGYWYVKSEEPPGQRFINYHAGPAPTVSVQEWPVIVESSDDPVFVLTSHFDEETLRRVSKEQLNYLREDLLEVH